MRIKVGDLPVIEIEGLHPNITYKNCSIGCNTVAPVNPVNLKAVIEHVHKRTGFNLEMVERVLMTADEFITGTGDNADFTDD